MKIAFFTEGYDPFINGVVTTIKTLRESLQRQGHEVVIFAPAYPGHIDADPQIVRLPSLTWSKTNYRCLRPFAGNVDVLAGQSFDVVHSHHPGTMSRLAARLAKRHRLPLVYSFHTMLNEYDSYVPLVPSLGKRLLTFAFLRHCAQADCVTVATTIVRDFLRAQGVQAPIAVVPEGVPQMHPRPDARRRIRAELGVQDGTQVLLYTGRLAKEKRLDFLLRAVARIGTARDFRLCLVGGGPMEADLRALAERLGIAGKVTFVGWVNHDDLADYYAAADLFVFPSPSDAMGIVLVEAMALGLPCVAIDRYGPSEVVVDGETGFLTAFDERDFSESIRRLLDNPFLRQRMGEAARRRARDFDPALAARRFVAVYEQVTALCPQPKTPTGSALAARSV